MHSCDDAPLSGTDCRSEVWSSAALICQLSNGPGIHFMADRSGERRPAARHGTLNDVAPLPSES